MDKFEGVPYGLFLGPKVSEWCPFVCPHLFCDPLCGHSWLWFQELEEVGGLDELEKELARIGRTI
jgi:beta-carotene 3-hydroxylase